jgi:hypothetical protein
MLAVKLFGHHTDYKGRRREEMKCFEGFGSSDSNVGLVFLRPTFPNEVRGNDIKYKYHQTCPLLLPQFQYFGIL